MVVDIERALFKSLDPPLAITDIGTIGTISFGNFATTQINMNIKIIFIFFKITQTKVSNANIYTYKRLYISFKIRLNKRFSKHKAYIVMN